MKAVILAGGKGTRLVEETRNKPKPMVKIGSKPMIWHIMKIYSTYGIKDFVICLGYKGDIIREFFNSMVSGSKNKDVQSMVISSEKWHVTLINTGVDTMTGGRLKRIKKYLNDETFCFTYGDTLNNVDIGKLVLFHTKKGGLATVTACIPPEKYGILKIKNDRVLNFSEKPENEKKWVNGGYFVLEPEVLDLIKGDETIWEKEPMQNLARSGKLFAYKHRGFYQPMDTLNEANYLNKLWKTGKAPWKVW